jgi:hypothetical protein
MSTMQGETFVEALTKVLVERDIIPASEAEALRDDFRDSQKPYFTDFLVEEGLVDKDDLLPALAQMYEVPAFDAVGHFFNHQLWHMFPKEFLISNAIIPLEQDENMLIFVASNPNDPELLPRIGEHVSYDLHFQVGLRQDIINAIEEYYEQALTEVDPDLDEDFDETREEREGDIGQDESLERIYEEDIELTEDDKE